MSDRQPSLRLPGLSGNEPRTGSGGGVLKVLEPGAIEAALVAAREAADGKDEHRRAAELELEQARYQAERSSVSMTPLTLRIGS